MTKHMPPYSPEVRARAVRMVFDHQGEHASQAAAISSIAAKIGCAPETLRGWVRQAERDQGRRAGPTTAEHERIRALEHENRELRQANEILRKASAYFAMAERRSTRAGSAARSSRLASRPRQISARAAGGAASRGRIRLQLRSRGGDYGRSNRDHQEPGQSSTTAIGGSPSARRGSTWARPPDAGCPSG